MMDVLGVTFGQYHTFKDWGLFQSAPVALSAPVLSSNYITIPGRNGPLDLTEALTGQPVYESRTLSGSFFTVSTPEVWPETFTAILNAIHGQRMKIMLDEDPDYYLEGRITVGNAGYDSGVYTLPITAVCDPYKLHHLSTSLAFDLTTTSRELTLTNDRMAVCPEITVTAETTLIFGDTSFTLSAGTWKLVGIQLQAGENRFTARTNSGTGTITFTYQEGSL
jgi:hypothetical protein